MSTITITSQGESGAVETRQEPKSGAPAPEAVETEAVSEETQEETPEQSASSEEVESEGEESSEVVAEAQSDDTEEETEDSEEEVKAEEEKPRKRKRGYQRKIGKMQSQIDAQAEELEYWKSRALRNKEDAPESSEVEVSSSTQKPQEEDFDTLEEWQEAVVDWRVDQKLAKRDEKQTLKQQEAQLQERVETLKVAVEDFKAKTPDFEEVIEELDGINMSPAVRELLLESDNAPELMYEMGHDVEFYEKLNGMSPLKAAKALGRFEARLSKSVETSQKVEPKTTKAPKPIKPVRAGKSVPVEKDPNKMTYQEYKAWMDKRRKA